MTADRDPTGRRDLARALRDVLRPGTTVFVHAGPAEPRALRAALDGEPDLARGVAVTGVFIPGINDHDYAAAGGVVTTSFVSGPARASFEAGRLRLLPLHYSDLTRYFAEHPSDLAILHCPPAREGRHSLGLNADFAGIAAAAARRRLVIVNPRLPWTGGHEPVRLRDGDIVVEDASAPLAPTPEIPDSAILAAAANAAALVRDGDTVQIGIGKVPGALVAMLHDRRALRIHSGIVTDPVAALVRAGAVDLERPDALVCGSAWGGPASHALVSDPRVSVAAASRTHDIRRLAAIDRLVAINSAVEVDLFGQVNGEAVRGRRVSGIGGASDFARGARLSPGGRSVIALSSTAGRHSRIVAAIAAGSVSQAAGDADIVVTEHGVASLRNLPLDGRAEALIAVADPAHRAQLTDAWHALRARL